MKNHMRGQNWYISRIITYACAIFLIVIIFFPFYWIVSSSLKNQSAIFDMPPQMYPHEPTLENYTYAIMNSKILSYSVNSVILAGSTMIACIVISVMAVYPLTRMKFRGKKVFFGLLAITQVFPVVITIVPLYMMFQQTGLYNTRFSLIFTYTATCIPICTVLLMGYFRDIPREMEEASIIDGCNRMQTLLKVVLPISLPGIVASAIYVFLSIWQEYLAAVSLLSDSRKYPLTVGLTLFRSEHTTNWGALMATAVVIAAPAIVLFFAIEKHFIDSLAGSVKE